MDVVVPRCDILFVGLVVVVVLFAFAFAVVVRFDVLLLVLVSLERLLSNFFCVVSEDFDEVLRFEVLEDFVLWSFFVPADGERPVCVCLLYTSDAADE